MVYRGELHVLPLVIPQATVALGEFQMKIAQM